MGLGLRKIGSGSFLSRGKKDAEVRDRVVINQKRKKEGKKNSA